MATHSAFQLLGAWPTAARTPAHQRLAVLLEALGAGGSLRDDTLGARNRRVLQLHRDLIGTPIEAHVACPQCGVDNEFGVPVDDILATPPPDVHASVSVTSRGRVLTFRLPRMSDLDAAPQAGTAEDVRRTVITQCRIDGELDALTEAAADQLGRAFEVEDPAANIVVNIACAGCARPLAASVDPATFVAREIDRAVDGLCREIHLLASAYGWDEETILSVPVERRRRYVRMIEARPARPRAAARPR